MKTKRHVVVLFICLLMSFCFGGIGGSDEDGGDADVDITEDVPSVAAVTQGEGEFGAFMVNRTGETLIPIVERDDAGNAASVTGAIWKNEDEGSSMVVYLDENGLPEKVILGEVILIFSNWDTVTETVDIAEVYGSSNYVEVFRDVSVDLSDYNEMYASLSLRYAFCFPTCESDAQNLAQLLKVAGLGISLGTCGVATTVSLGAMALPCAGLIVGTAIAVVDDDEWLDDLEGAGSILTNVEFFQCLLGDAASCVSAALDNASSAIEGTVDVDAEYADLQDLAAASLDDQSQESGVIRSGDGPPAESYECTYGGSMHYEPCLSGGYKECQSDGTYSQCPNVPDIVCGDGTCESGETSSSCSIDCEEETYCGDGSCNGDETESSCSADCGDEDSDGDADGDTDGGSGSGDICYGVTSSCSACSIENCVTTDSEGACDSQYYTSSDGYTFTCASCGYCSAAAQEAANHCVSVCYGL